MVGGRYSQLQVTRRLARRASQRAMVGRFVSLLGVALVAGAGLLLGAVVIGKLSGWSFDLVMPGAVAGAAAVLGSSIVAMMGRWTEQQAAIEIDHAMGLDDALSSAMDLEHDAAGNDDAFCALALHDAERAAERIDARTVTPIGFGLNWIAWPIVGAAVVAAAMFIPELKRERADMTQARLAVSQVQAEAEVQAAIDVVQETIADAEDESGGATPEQLDMLDELERELAAGNTTGDEAVQRAADALDQRADALEESAIEEAMAQESLADRFDDLDPSELDEASDLAEALRNGDMNSARRAVREMSRTIDDLSQEERDALAEDLNRLADQFDELDVDTPGPDATESLESQGLTSEQAQRLVDETDPEEIAETLRESGMDPQGAQRAAEDIAEQNRERQAEERARDETQDMRDSLRRASDQLKEQPPEQQQEQPADQQEQESPGASNEGESGNQTDEGQSPNEQPNPDAQGREQGQEQSQEQGQEQEQEQGEGAEGEQQGESTDPSKPGEEQQEGTEGGEPGESGETDPSTPDPDQPGQEPGQETGEGVAQDPAGNEQQPDAGQPGDEQGEQQTPTGDESQQNQPGQEQGVENDPSQPGEQPTGQDAQDQSGEGVKPDPSGDQQQPGEGATPGERTTPTGDTGTPTGDSRAPGDESQEQTPGEALDDLERQFDRLGSARDRVQEDRASAEELRQRAQEMLERMTPEERKEMLKRWSAAQRDRQNRTASTDPVQPMVDPSQDQPFDRVDMSRPDKEATDRVIARWLSEGEVGGEGPDAPTKPDFAGTIRRSRESAEKAFEQQRIPRRHQDLVRRVFDRFAKRAESAEGQSESSGPKSGDPDGSGPGGN